MSTPEDPMSRMFGDDDWLASTTEESTSGVRKWDTERGVWTSLEDLSQGDPSYVGPPIRREDLDEPASVTFDFPPWTRSSDLLQDPSWRRRAALALAGAVVAMAALLWGITG